MAKNLMGSVPDYLLIETAFTIVQWVLVTSLTVVASDWLGARPDAIARVGSTLV